MDTSAIILAAGAGTRMKSAKPKVAHEIMEKPLVSYVIDAAHKAGVSDLVAVLGHGRDVVAPLVEGDCRVVVQEQQRGTADAVNSCRELFEGHEGCVWVWCGKGAVFLTDADDLTIIAGSESGFTRVSFIDEDGTEMTGYVIDPESPPNELGRISLSGDGPFNYEDVGMSIRQALRAGELDYDGALYLWKVGTNTVFAVKPDAYTLIDGTQVSFTDDGSQLCFCRILDTDISE